MRVRKPAASVKISCGIVVVSSFFVLEEEKDR